MKVIHKNISSRLKNITRHLTGVAKIITLCFIIFTLSFIIITPCFNPASAVKNAVDFTVELEESATVTLPSAPINLSVIPTSDGAFGSANVNVTVNSNSTSGYTMNMNLANTFLQSDTYNPTASEFPKILSLDEKAGGYTESDFTNNRWGFAVGSAPYNAFRTVNQLKDTNTVAAGDSTVVTLATKLDLDTAPGSYSTTINFEVVPKAPAVYYMHEVDTWRDTALINANDSVKATDIRDGKKYWVTKLSNGQIWMTQNLDLNIKTSGTNGPDGVHVFTSNDTDLNASGSAPYATDYTSDGTTITWTPSNDKINTMKLDEYRTRNWSVEYYIPQSMNPGNWYQMGAYFNSGECQYLSDNCDYFSTTPFPSNASHGHLGNYYNWAAVIASSYANNSYSGGATMPNSICPKGWRLPSQSNGDFQFLNNSYNGGLTNTDAGFINSPLFMTRAGYVYDDTFLKLPGFHGGYWSSTFNSGSSYSLAIEPKGVYLSDAIFPFAGLSVRCLARDAS